MVWVSNIREEFGFWSIGKVKVQQDNKACTLLPSDELVNLEGRFKFIDRKYFSVCEHVKSGRIKLVLTGGTDDMIFEWCLAWKV